MLDFDEIQKQRNEREQEQQTDGSYAKARNYAGPGLTQRLVSDTEGFERVCRTVIK